MMPSKLRIVVLAACCAAALVSLPVSKASKAEQLAWLEANADKEGVVVLPSGLQYKVLVEGGGSFHPAESSDSSVHYSGTLTDGTEFDSSYKRGQPATFAPNEVISGWTTVLQMMVEGDKWEVYIPSDLAYGDSGYPPTIPGGATLIFQMELLEILGRKVPANKEEEHAAAMEEDSAARAHNEGNGSGAHHSHAATLSFAFAATLAVACALVGAL